MKQEYKLKKIIRELLTYGLMAFALCSCSIFSSSPQPPEKEPEVYKVSFRQLPPPPVYNRVRQTYLPQNMPDAALPEAPGVALEPDVKLSVRAARLEDVGKELGSIGNYSSYTASSVANQKVSLEAYGTLDQVAKELSSKTGANVVVDHANKEIRILQTEDPEINKPKFAEAN